MSDDLGLGTPSALNLTLEGAAGHFRVGMLAGARTVGVNYLLTQVNLRFDGGAPDKVLQHLGPVREILPVEALQFDELMQRDIDDARVSGELIPYLLDASPGQAVKLFPPVVVVVLPVDGENRPLPHYPAGGDETPTGKDVEWPRMWSGGPGTEVFDLAVHHRQGAIGQYARLQLNTNACKLVIVDGQHRAMALLALYRNMREEWSDERRAPFRQYYEEWTKDLIKKFDLAEISLPMMFCVFPELRSQAESAMKVTDAARSIFLTLNKNARPVTIARNRLLDDNDIIALCLRDTLSQIRQFDSRSPESLRIVNVELDQTHDRVKIESPVAITSVNHLYYIIEHLLLNVPDSDIQGVKPRGGRFDLRTDLASYNSHSRLRSQEVLTAKEIAECSRDSFPEAVERRLAAQYRKHIGSFLVRMLAKWQPYVAHTTAVQWLDQELKNRDRRFKSILLDGEGQGRTLRAHYRNLTKKVSAGGVLQDAASLKAICANLAGTLKQVDDLVGEFRKKRASEALASLSDKPKARGAAGEWLPELQAFVDSVYNNVITTVAFQAALVCTFVGEVERRNIKDGRDISELEGRDQLCDEYLAQVGRWFTPVSATDIKKLHRVFVSELEGELSQWEVRPSRSTFREVVIHGEMQPDQWPKYRHMLLEIWRPGLAALADIVESERLKAREQVFASVHQRVMSEWLTVRLKRQEELTPAEWGEIEEEAYRRVKGFWLQFGWRVDELPAKEALLASLRPKGVELEASPSDEEAEAEDYGPAPV